MMTVIDLSRKIRETHNKPLKSPLKEMVIVHPDSNFLEDISGKLREYVLEELNVKSLITCNDILRCATLCAEPDFSVLGKMVGKSMGDVAKKVKSMSTEEILTCERVGEITIGMHVLKIDDIKIIREFKPIGNNANAQEMDARGDGDMLVVLDLRSDDEAGIARGVVNWVQKMRKKAGLEPTDLVEVYSKLLDGDEIKIRDVLESNEAYLY